MSELVEKLRAAIELAEQHADKDLWTVAQCTANPSTWTAWYGHDLPESAMVLDDGTVILRAVGALHEADIFAVSRAVKRIERQALATKRQVAAYRTILVYHRAEDWTDGHCAGCGFDFESTQFASTIDKCPVLLALAEAYGIEP